MTIRGLFLILLNFIVLIVCEDIIYDDRRVCMDSVSSCVEVESQPNQLEFTVYGPHDVGYLAVGVKRSDNKDEDSVFVTWFDSSGIPNVVEMLGYNFTNPDLVNDTDANLILSQSKLMSDRKVISFTHPLSEISHDDLPFQIVNNSLTLTLVYSDQVPRTRGKYKPQFPKYDIISTTHVPLLSAPTVKPVIYTTAVILAHAITMMLGWMVFPALGIYVARYLKRLMDVWWFYLHILFMMFAGVLIVFGMSILAITGPFMWELSVHGLMGCIVVGLFVFNFFLGILIDRLWDPDRLHVPIQDKIHWWIGRCVPILGIVTIGFGIFQLDSTFNRLPWLISFIVLIVLNIMLFFLNPIFSFVKRTIKGINERRGAKKEGEGDADSENGEVETQIQVDYDVEGKKWEHF